MNDDDFKEMLGIKLLDKIDISNPEDIAFVSRRFPGFKINIKNDVQELSVGNKKHFIKARTTVECSFKGKEIVEECDVFTSEVFIHILKQFDDLV